MDAFFKRAPFLLIFLFVVLTNRYYFTADDPEFITSAAGDTWSYKSIADSAPALPEVKMPYHYAQRFIVPYLVGIIAKAACAPTEWVMRFLVAAFFLGSLGLTWRFCRLLTMPFAPSFALSFMVFSNPYLVRLDLAFPYFVNDSGFVFGLILLLSGIHFRSSPQLVLGATIAILCRQTAMILILPLSILLFLESISRPFARSRFIAIVGTLLILVASYMMESKVALRMSTKPNTLDYISGLLPWLSHEFDFKILLDFLVRGGTAFFVTVSILWILFRQNVFSGDFIQDRNNQSIGLFLMTFGLIALQPILGGPHLTGGNVARLSVMGLWPLVFCWPLIRNFSVNPSAVGKLAFEAKWKVLVAVLAVASFHHLFSWPGSILFRSSPFAFAVSQIVIATVIIPFLSSKLKSTSGSENSMLSDPVTHRLAKKTKSI